MMYEATDHSNQPLVLAVDDDMSLRLMMREALEQAGFAVAEAENGQQALALYEQLQPAIVLLDVLMPELDGFETCAALRGLPGGADTPVLMVTGLNDMDSINQAYEVGATDFLTKPITWGLLGHRVRYLLRSSKAFEKLRNSEEALQTAHAELEKRVQERTADLATANARLQQEMQERQRVAQEQRRLQAQLFQVQKLEALGTLASGIAHDFNNLLTVMVSFSELAKEAMPAETEAAENLEQVLKASHQAKELVEQILTFSRPSPQARQPVRLQDIVTEILNFLRRVFPRTIDIQADLDKTASVALLDAAQMRQVIMNLGVNACQAMADDSGTLEVRLGETVIEDSAIQAHPALKPGSYLQLTVRDTGCGMSDQVVEHIFDPFFSTKVPGEGSGMGLAIVHGIVAAHDGVITVESQLGHGTTFQVYLPRFEEIRAPASSAQQDTPIGNGRVLFVDDEEALTRMAQQVLESLGYEAVVMTNSRDALELVRTTPQHFDIVVTDRMMPHLKGEELATELLHIRPDLPIIMCTGFSATFTAQRAKELGIREYLQKPLSKRELGQALQRALALPRQKAA